MATKAIGYIRVSTDQQANEGVSLAAQRAKLVAYCALYDLDLASVHVDAGASASSLDRPGLQAALAELDAGAVLVVVKLDRLTRSVRDLDTLLTRYFAAGRYGLVSVGEQIDTTTATGRMILSVLTSVSQWEREVIGERTSVAMQHKRSELEYTGGRVRYGYTIDADGSSLVEAAAEQAIISAVLEYRAAGLSYRAVATELGARGWTNRAGRPFAAASVRCIERGAA